ncbi:MAG TPA: lasso peptide biosynthesis B2 protein [Acidimicrobiia bacterium]|nr:lasso peptide biosynthesis B2 protein [Acidimicrobiia bacterium]
MLRLRRRTVGSNLIFSRVWSLPFRDQLTLARMLGLAAIVEVGLRTVGLPRLATALGVKLNWAREPSSPPGIPPSLREADRRNVTFVLRVMRHWPFAEGTCLRQSIILGRVLKDHAPLLRIGVQGRGGDIVAHAWIELDGVAMGGEDGYLPLWSADDNGLDEG